MNLIILPGNSKDNLEWSKRVEAELTPMFDFTQRVEYSHWNADRKDIDLDKELQKLQKALQVNTPYCVFAKSVGTLLAAQAMSTGTLKPAAGLFIGLPLHVTEHYDLPLRDWLKSIDTPIGLIQHTDDPAGSFAEVVSYLKSAQVHTLKLTELPGKTHSYHEYEAMRTHFQSLLSQPNT